MKIKKLIEVYEQLEPLYKMSLKRKDLYHSHFICVLADRHTNTSLRSLFSFQGYYKNYIKVVFQFGVKTFVLDTPGPFTKEGTQARLEFIQKEIVHLKTLLSEGYTDV